MPATILMRLLTALALMLMPLAMAASGPAAAHAPAASADGSHCEDKEGAPAKGEHRPGGGADCAIACSALPPAEPLRTGAPAPRAAAPAVRFQILADGLHPEAAIPPPRGS
jgi:hypothetical protein